MSVFNPIAIKKAEAWVRPTEWLTQPTYTTGQQQIDLLVGVGENGVNDIAFNISTSTGTYSVDWGDSYTSTGVASGVNAEHLFDWADISSDTIMSNGFGLNPARNFQVLSGSILNPE